MPAIPAAYLQIVNPLVNQARALVEQGETLEALAFVGNLTTRQIATVAMNPGSEQAKDAAAQRIRETAEAHDADFVFIVMEAWSLPPNKIKRMHEIVERFGSIGASPYRVDIVSFSLETRYGIWVAQLPLRPKAGSKKKRTFGKPEFRLFTEAEGRFAALLPGKSETEIPPLQ
jgi:hypothetical protein